MAMVAGTVLHLTVLPLIVKVGSLSYLQKTNILYSTAVSIFVVILVELTNTAFVNSTNITTIIETAALSTYS